MSALTHRQVLSENKREPATGPGPYGVALIVCACAAVPVACALVSAPSVDGWYAGVPKPSWAPPEWIFGSVWTALYATMALAASIVWLSRRRDDVCCPLTAFGVQLALNLAWSVCFFALKSPLLAFLDVCLLWVITAVTTAEFFLVSRTAGWLMVPSWLWVTFAAILNGAVLIMSA
jgi:tryptophan-rich sensory protein